MKPWLKYIPFATLPLMFWLIPPPEIEPALAYMPPWFHTLKDFSLLGHSPLGESVASLLFWGLWQSILIAAGGRLLATLLSLAGGAIAHLGSDKGNFLITRLSEAAMTLPSLLIALSLGFILGEGIEVMIIVIALSEWGINQKWILGRIKEYERFEFIEAARMMGAGRFHILSYQFRPWFFEDLKFLFFLYLPSSLLTVAALEFLGFSGGSQIPGLGYQVASNKDLIFIYPHVILPPVLIIIAAVLFFVGVKNKIEGKA